MLTAKALRSIRLALNFSLQQFAERTGLPVHDLDAYERGEKAIDAHRLSAGLERLASSEADHHAALLQPRSGDRTHERNLS